MAENKVQKLPAFSSLDEMVEFFDAHDMGDYPDSLPEVSCDVDIQRRTHLVAIDEKINSRLAEIARQEQTPVESLVNAWLEEKVASYSEKT
ncbi:MAG TPA: CopG family antitoxin [Pyrinomonadaceae bacterium]|jgi:hypothetical protein|nr:CopG family antitoxin [Pyrinomonadaceae bacterium]